MTPDESGGERHPGSVRSSTVVDMNEADTLFGGEAFAVRAAVKAGVPESTLRGRRFERPFPGVRRVRGPARETTDVYVSVAEVCGAYLPRLGARQFFSHTTALELWGAPTPVGWRTELHVALWHPDSPPNIAGVIAHRLRPRDERGTMLRGMPVETFTRAWVQACGRWRPDDLIAAADFGIHHERRLTTIDELRAELIRCRKGKFLPLLDDVRDGAESARETLLRLVLVRAGLPEPALNVDVFDSSGTFIARLDLLYARWRVAPEYDGRQHADDVDQFRRDATRWDDLRAAGWVVVRILSEDLAHGGAEAVRKVRRALVHAGWDGSR